MPFQEDGVGAGGDAVDGYISNYFRRVAELNRESVYQAHQRVILSRMRDDLAAGDRCGSMRDLDERLQRVELSDQTLRSEIATRMRIVERVGPAHCGGRTNCCAPAACCAAGGQAALPGSRDATPR